jgi:2-oxo-4-hydroxy-4-carboxy-5-ureidoimidazoline decarboxylase
MAGDTAASSALEGFNALPGPEARAVLLTCCASSTWAERVAAGRPYATAAALLDAADAASRDLSPADVAEALSAHPRIGDRVEGASAEARWSRREQASVAAADAGIRAQLRAGNAAYEERFGQVFLLRAAGRPPAEMLAQLRRRLGNDPDTERREVVEQLRQITRLRLEGLLSR